VVKERSRRFGIVKHRRPFAKAQVVATRIGVSWSLVIAAAIGGIAVIAFIIIRRLVNLCDRSQHALGFRELILCPCTA
jgi:hypothetical protein